MSSTKGYKLKKIIYKKEASFDFRNELIFNRIVLDKEGLKEGVSGIITITYDEAKDLYQDIKNGDINNKPLYSKTTYSKSTVQDALQMLKNIMIETKENGYADYYCW